MRNLLLTVMAVVWLTACRGGQTQGPAAQGDTIAFKYARLLSVVHHEGYTVATVSNPWKTGAMLHRYVLVPRDGEIPSDLPEGTVLHTPLQRAVMFTTVHCAMLMEFGKQDCIAGVADLKYIKIPWIQEQVKAGRITDVGDGLSPVTEKIIDQGPDALFLSPFENSGGYGKLEEIGTPIVECAEYMEPSPLARAEWIRFYGMLFGCEAKADSLFHAVDSSYHALKALAAGTSVKSGESGKPSSSGSPARSALLDKVTGNVWYVPGGCSTIGQMVRDANGRYPWMDDEHSGSISMPFETVLEKAADVDVWIFRYGGDHTITYDELRREHHGYDQFKAFRTHKVYGCNVEQCLFYEESPFHPDWLLSDFIHILHPDLMGLPPLRYYQKL